MIKLALHAFLVWPLLFLHNRAIKAQQTDPFFLYQDCTSLSMFTENSTYGQNLNTLLSRLEATAGMTSNGFGNDTVGESISNAVYGIFFCPGDITTEMCSSCVSYATNDRLNRTGCPSTKTVLLGYEECMLHYSDESIHSKLQLQPSFPIFDPALRNVTNTTLFADVLRDTASRVIPRAVTGRRGKKFAVAKAPLGIHEPEYRLFIESLYMLAQCTPDLTNADCNECLTKANEALPQGKREGRVITPSCYIRFDINLFYDEAAAAWADASANVTSNGMEDSFLHASEFTSKTDIDLSFLLGSFIPSAP